MSIRDFFQDTPARDFLDLFCGKRIGSGMSRIVYEYALDPTLVIKFEPQGGHFQNIIEDKIWSRYQYTDWVRKWLAPVKHISPCGIVMLQARTTPIKSTRLPSEIPHWCSDEKHSNWGLYKGKPVMHDYAVNLMMDQGVNNKRLKKADWTYDIWEGRE